MMRRGWQRRLAPALLALLAAASLPRTVLLAHHHDGDDHAHVHPFGVDADHGHDADHDHEALEHHHHHHDGGADLEPPEVFHRDHVHWQQPFQRAGVPVAPRLVRTDSVAPMAASRRAAPAFTADVPAPARGPPRPSPLSDS